MFRKKYKTTSKIEYAFKKYIAMDLLTCKYVAADKHDRAVKAQIDTQILKDKAWGLVYDLYPELKGKSIKHRMDERELTINK